MTVHSTQLGANGAIAAGGATLYTVPAGKRTILKSVVLQNNAAGANRIILRIDLVGGGNMSWGVTVGAAGGASESMVIDCWIVLNAGDVLKVNPTSSFVEAIASGAQLTT
jgi:hypothetical protein